MRLVFPADNVAVAGAALPEFQGREVRGEIPAGAWACRGAGSVRRAAGAVSAREVPEWDAVAAGNSLPRADGPVTSSLGRHAPVGG